MDLTQRYHDVMAKIAAAATKARREPKEVSLIAITKNATPEDLRALWDLGHRQWGESKIQTLQQHVAQIQSWLPPNEGPTWHVVGHLQRNKVKPAIQLASYIHSVDSLRLAEEIQLAATRLEKSISIMLEVNTSEDSGKFGVAVGAAQHLAEQIDTMEGVHLAGVMAMAPLTEDPQRSRSCFSRLREVFEEIRFRKIGGPQFRHLSMGTSQDYTVAIEEGATMVRIGSALFGPATGSDDEG